MLNLWGMKKKVLYGIIAFICISLAGSVVVQYFWINNAIQVKEAQFNRSVNEALGAVVNKLETREDIIYLKKNLVGDSIHALVQAFSKDPILALNDKLDSLLRKILIQTLSIMTLLSVSTNLLVSLHRIIRMDLPLSGMLNLMVIGWILL